MGRDYRLSKCAMVLLTCASLVAYPCLIHAGPFLQIEVDDTKDFGASMKKFLGGEGFDGAQMQEFLQAPKREWDAILDRFANEFGFSPRLITTLLSGRVVARIDKNAFFIGSIQKDAEEVNSLVAETKKLLESSSDIKAKIEEGQDAIRITVSTPGSVLLVGAKGNRFVVAGGQDQKAAEQLCDHFIVGVLESILDKGDTCPELRGKGILMMQDASAMIGDDAAVDGRPASGAAPWISGPSFSRMYFKDDDLWVIGYIPGRKSLPGSLYVEGPVSESSLDWLPVACESAAALHFNLAELIPTLLENEGGAEGQPAPGIGQSMEMVKRMFGFDPQNELLTHIGDEMVFGQLPTEKGGGFPVFSAMGLGSVYGVIRLQNPMAFEAGLDKLLTLLGGIAAQDTVGGGLRRTTVGGLTVRYLRVACGVLSPCFAIKDNYLVVTGNVPLMRFLLTNHGSWKTLTEDGDFRANLALLSEKPTSGFSYKRYRHRDGAGGATAAMTGIAITGILAGKLIPALSKARGAARETVNMNTLKLLGMASLMFKQDNNRYPENLKEITKGGLVNQNILKGESEAIYYCRPEGANPSPIRPLMYSFRSAGNKQGMNILFVDGHVAFHPAGSPKYQEALTLKAMPLNPGAAKEAAPGAPGSLTADRFNAFLTTEARNLAMSVDFALFPTVGDFSREGSSNISIVDVRKSGLFSKAKIGHISGGSGDSMVVVAIIAIIAAIAIPSLMTARGIANKTAAMGGGAANKALPTRPQQ